MYSTVNLGFAEFSMAIFKSVQDKIMRLFWLFSVGTHACNQMSVKFHLRCKIIVFWVKSTSFRKSSELVRLSLWEVILFFSLMSGQYPANTAIWLVPRVGGIFQSCPRSTESSHDGRVYFVSEDVKVWVKSLLMQWQSVNFRYITQTFISWFNVWQQGKTSVSLNMPFPLLKLDLQCQLTAIQIRLYEQLF